MDLFKAAFVVLIIAIAPGCKITQIVPEGGHIVSRSGLHDCNEFQTCVIDVKSGSTFSDTFTGVAKPGYYFNGWKKQWKHLCGGNTTSCALENIPSRFTSLDVEVFLTPEFLPGAAPLQPGEVQFQRHVEFSAQVSLLYPARWSRSGSRTASLATFQEQLESPDDVFREFVSLTKTNSSGLSPAGTNLLKVVSKKPYAIAGFNGEETIYHLILSLAPKLKLSIQQIEFEFNGEFYSLLHVAERHTLLRNIELVRAMADSMTVGQPVFEDYGLTSDLGDPGKPAIASDGTDFLWVSCREDAPNSHQYSLVGRVVRQDRSMGKEFEIHPNVDTFNSGCRHTQYQLVHTGESYLLVYMALHEGVRNIVARRLDAGGTLLDPEPVVVSGISRGSVFSPALTFDGSRSLVVWNETDNDGGNIRAAFIAPDGTVNAPFTVAANLAQLHQVTQEFIYTPEVASSASGFMVVWNRYYFGDTLSAIARPLYGQALDLAGNKLSSEPLLIRGDAGTNPRYAEVESDGENYLVAWIEGRLPTNTVYGGDAGIYAQQISASGELLSGAPASPVVIVDETFTGSSDPNWSATKQFFDLAFDGASYTAIWSALDNGLYAAEVSTDLADISVPFAVSGVKANGLESLARAREGTIAYSDTTGVVSWTSRPMEAWFFKKKDGISALNPKPGPATTYSQPENTATATLVRGELPRWFAAVEQVSQLGTSAQYWLEPLRIGDYLPGDIIENCYLGGHVTLEARSPIGMERLSFDDCAYANNLSMNGVLVIHPEESSGAYGSTTRVSTDGFTLTKSTTVNRYSGEFTVLRSTLGLLNPRLRFNMDVTTSSGITYQLEELGFNVAAADTPSLTNLYGFSGHLITPGGSFQAHSGAPGTPIQLLGTTGNRAEFNFEENYTDILFYPDGTRHPVAGVRLDNRPIVDFFDKTDSTPQAVDPQDFDHLGVQARLYTIRDQGVEGASYTIDVGGTITDLKADPLEYEVTVSQVERVTERGFGTAELISVPRFSLTRTAYSSFELSRQDAGIYTLQVVATDTWGNVSDMQEFHVTILPDADGDGFLDKDDFDDDNDGVADHNDPFPKDPTETLDSDLDGIGDNADLDDDNDGTDDIGDVYPLNASCARANEGNSSGCYVEFVGNRRLLFDTDQTLYFFEGGSRDIARWNVSEEGFVDQIVLGSIVAADDVVNAAVIVANHNRLYLGYESGAITYISLDDITTEVFFAQVANPVGHLADAVNFLLAFHNPDRGLVSGWIPSNTTVGVFNQSRELIAETTTGFFSLESDYVFDAAQQLFYDKFLSGDLDINTGEIIAEQDKFPTLPFVSSPDGAFSLRINGEILDITSGAVIGALAHVSRSNNESANNPAAWTGTGISYIRNSNYHRVDVDDVILEKFDAPGEYSRALYPYGVDVLHIADGGTSHNPLKISIIRSSNDTDGDGVDNLADAFPNNAEASLDADHDAYPDTWNAGYTSGGSSDLTLDAYPGAVDCYLPQHGDGINCDPTTTIQALLNEHFVALGNDGIVYMLGYQQRINRYSLSERRYLGSLRVGSTNPYLTIPASPRVMVYSAAENRLYLGYANYLSYLDLADPTQEILLTKLERAPKLLQITDDYVVVGVEFHSVRYFYDKTGNFVQSSDNPRFPESMAWDKTQNLLYTLEWPSGVYVEPLDPAAFTGEATLLADIPFNDQPVLVSRDGKYLVSHTNEVYNAADGSVFTVLPGPSNSFNTFLWLSNGGLAALYDRKLSIYNADFEIVADYADFEMVADSSRLRGGIALLEREGMLVIISRSYGLGPYGLSVIPIP
jgi:hypothetical protein